jgi:hypothetical protein
MPVSRQSRNVVFLAKVEMSPLAGEQQASRRILGRQITMTPSLSVYLRVTGCAAVSVVTSTLLPALRASRFDLQDALRGADPIDRDFAFKLDRKVNSSQSDFNDQERPSL